MRMFRSLVVACAVVVAGCVSYGDAVDHSMTLRGDYKAVADCAYDALLGEPVLGDKVDLDSKNMRSILFRDRDNIVGRINFISAGPNATRVDAHMGYIVAKGYVWRSRWAPKIQTCG